MYSKGLVIVISAPSGAGKSTLCARLVERLPDLRYSISCTTRPPRRGERDGIDYFFISEKRFKDMIRRNAFAEWAVVHGYYYGTPKRFLKKTVNAGKDVVLDIDVQGGVKLRRAYRDAVLIFVMAPSMKTLEQRLRARKKDSEEVIRQRLINARRELRFLPRYDYLVINDRLETACEELRAILTAEHLRIDHRPVPRF